MPGDRRQLKSRDTAWARAASTWLARRGVTPNHVSLMSMVCAAVACAGFVLTRSTASPLPRSAFLLLAIAGMQGRLICNLLDGMIAVEAGVGSGPLGEIYNDLPDRVADVVIFIGAGVCAGGISGPLLGLGAGIGSLLTAYVRVLGRSIGAKSYFIGPMAKQHRMAVMTAGCLVGIGVTFMNHWLHVWMRVPLGVVIVGCVVTAVRRLAKIAHDLRPA